MADAVEALFSVGDRVRVRVDQPTIHHRTPNYVKGRAGTIAGLHGAFRNPESLAHGGDGLPKQPLYLVKFPQPALWGNPESTRDTLCADIFQHWLEPVEEA